MTGNHPVESWFGLRESGAEGSAFQRLWFGFMTARVMISIALVTMLGVMYSLPTQPVSGALVLTGMGSDGAKGLLEMKNAGAYTIGQNERSSVVYGMPRIAFELGGVVSANTGPDTIALVYVGHAR